MYLEPWRTGSARVPGHEVLLAKLVSDNPAQAARVERLRQAADLRLKTLRENLDLAQSGNMTAAQDRIASGIGKLQMDRIRVLAAEVMAVERTFAARQAKARKDEQFSLLLTLGLGGAALLFLTFMVIAMARSNQALSAALAGRDAAETGRRDADALVRAVFENIPDYLYTFEVTPDGRFLVGDFNPALAKLLGGDMTPYRGRDVMEAFPVMGPRLDQALQPGHRDQQGQRPARTRRMCRASAGSPGSRCWPRCSTRTANRPAS